MDNAQMQPGRYARWAKARRTVKAIQGHLTAGHTVVIGTYTKAWRFDKPAHADLFRAERYGAYMRRGRSWDCIDYCGIRVFGPAA